MAASRTARAALTVAAVVCGQIFLAALPASAHKHPTPVELDSPGVVYIETSARVEISLIEHRRAGLVPHISLVQRTYQPVLSTSSGFSVNPAGAIVTSAAAITPDLGRAVIYSVNQIFHERYGSAAPLPTDPFTEHSINNLADDPINQRLQRCYQPNVADETGGCVVAVTRVVTVYPYVASQEKYGALPAEVLSPKPGQAGDVAVLRVGASSMPTVDLARSIAGVEAISVLGFTGIPGSTAQPVKGGACTAGPAVAPESCFDAHTNGPGVRQIKHDPFFNAAVAGLQAGMRGGPIVGPTGQVVGFFVAPQPQNGQAGTGDPVLIDAAQIRTALTAVGVTPQRGPTDAVYESAMHNFKNSLFAASIPSLQKTLQFYPGHYLAAHNLAIAESKKGTAADLTGKVAASLAPTKASSSHHSGLSGKTLVAVIVGPAVLLVVVVAALILLRRRRKPPSAAIVPPDAKKPAPVKAASAAPRAGDSKAGSTPVPRKTPAQSRGGAASTAKPATPAAPAPPTSSTSGVNSANSAAPSRPSAAPAGPSSPAPSPTAGARPASSAVSVLASESNSASASQAGAPAPGQTFCTSCGHRLATENRFCGWCGHVVG